MANYTVFYSWQSDLLGRTNRTLIQTALEKAVASIASDDELEIDTFIVQRDTKGLPGTPNIAEAIFERIRAADIFVADVSIVTGAENPRPAPNPNVLIETGYALHALGEERLIFVMNTSYGAPQLLPFDLHVRRAMQYNSPAEAAERATARNELAGELENALRSIISAIREQAEASQSPEPSLQQQLINAVENERPNAGALARRYMDEVIDRIRELAPDFTKPESVDPQSLVSRLDETVPIVAEFAGITGLVAEMNSEPVAEEIFRSFAKLLDLYNRPLSFTEGEYYPEGFGFARFIGHEMLVVLIQKLITHGRWGIITNILTQELHVQNSYLWGKKSLSFSALSKAAESLNGAGSSPSHAQLLHRRHTETELSLVSPLESFVEADYFLFLRSEFESSEISEHLTGWRPWSLRYAQGRTPSYILNARSHRQALTLSQALGIDNIEVLKQMLRERAPKASRMYPRMMTWDRTDPLYSFDIDSIGTR